MAFRFDTQHLSPQTQAIIRKRDENDKLLKAESERKVESPKRIVFPTAIFMKLGHDGTSNYDGIQTMQIYENFCKQNGAVWFSTDSLTAGMSEKRRTQFINAINQNKVVKIYFAIGKSSRGSNEIEYNAEVIDIKTDSEVIPSPEKLLTPDEWKNDKNKIWIKIKSLHRFTRLTASDFVVESSGNMLANSIAHSQYHFGYIKEK